MIGGLFLFQKKIDVCRTLLLVPVFAVSPSQVHALIESPSFYRTAQPGDSISSDGGSQPGIYDVR